MRHLFSLIIGLVFSFSIGKAQTTSDSTIVLDSLKRLFSQQQMAVELAEMPVRKMPPTEIRWDTTLLNFGEIREDSIWKGKFIFHNTGNQPFILQAVKPSCGCTAVSWTEETVLPQQSGYIEVSFRAANQSGHRKKSLTLTGNFLENIRKILYLEGEVIPTEF